MTAELSITNQTVHLAYRDWQAPWHKLGLAVPTGEKLSATEMFERAHLNYKRIKAPYTVTLDGFDPIVSADYALIRLPFELDPKPVVMGTVSESYEVLDNMETAKALDGLATYLPIDVVGSLRRYTYTFAAFKSESFALECNGQREEVGNYLVFLDDNRPGNALKFMLTSIRPVCMNTVSAGEKIAKVNITMPHTTGAADYLKWTADILAQIAKQQDAIKESMQALASKPVTEGEATTVINAAFPIPLKPVRLELALANPGFIPMDKVMSDTERWEMACERMKEYRRAAENTYRGGVEGAAGTAWGALHSVSYVCDHVSIGKRLASEKARAESALTGERHEMKVRAWNAAMELVEA